MLGDPQYGGYPDPNPAGLVGPASSDGPMGYPVGQAASQPLPADAKRSSKLGLIIVCVLVLVLAATVTFVALRFRAQLGF